MNDIQRTINTIGHSLSVKSPHILTGLGIGGFIVSTIMAVSVTPKAKSRLVNFAFDNAVDIDDITMKEKVEICWDLYLPSGAMTLISAGSIISANRIQSNRLVAAAGLYNVTAEALMKFQEAVEREEGKATYEKIRGEVSQETLHEHPQLENAIDTGNGPKLMFDITSGRYFYSDIEKVRQSINNINERLISEMFVTLNDVYYELGIPPNELGQNFGWEMATGQVTVEFDTKLTEKQDPCIVMMFKNLPNKLWI